MCLRLKPLASMLVEIEGVIDVLEAHTLPESQGDMTGVRPLGPSGFTSQKTRCGPSGHGNGPPNAWNRYHGSYQISKDSLILM
jgi:hypothetical protein